jgi:hypothetical protein
LATAQTASSNTPTSRTSASQPASFQQALDTAKQLAKAGNLTSAEQTLTAQSLFPANTAEWHLETSQKLMQMTVSLARDGKNDQAVNAAANLALQHSIEAVSATSDKPTQARAKASAAFIYLHYLGDPVSALSSLRAAALLNPNDPAIQQALTRLENADAKLRSRIHAATN